MSYFKLEQKIVDTARAHICTAHIQQLEREHEGGIQRTLIDPLSFLGGYSISVPYIAALPSIYFFFIL